MILLLGATGYVGQAFAGELRRRGDAFVPLTRKAIDYTRFEVLFDYVRRLKPKFVINAAGYVGKPSVDACEFARAEAVQGNTLFPQTVARVCFMTNIPWGHVSSGSIYAGAKVVENGSRHIERDLSQPRLLKLFSEHPERFHGFTEMDEPNFSFRNPPCNFYSGTKALAEEVLRPFEQTFVWRIRRPFAEVDHPRNFLTKIQSYPKVYHSIDSFSHLGDFVRACLDLKQCHAPFGVYNIVNPGAVTSAEVVETVRQTLGPRRRFEFWTVGEAPCRLDVKAPRSNCILDISKLQNVGVKLRPVREALEHSLERWQSQAQSISVADNILPFLPAAEMETSMEPRSVIPRAQG